MITLLVAPPGQYIPLLFASGRSLRYLFDVPDTQRLKLTGRDSRPILVRKATAKKLAIYRGGRVVEYHDAARDTSVYQICCLQSACAISIYGYDDDVSRFDRGLVSDNQPAYLPQHVLSVTRHTCRKNGQHQHRNNEPVPAPELKSATCSWAGALDLKRIAHQGRINTPDQFAHRSLLFAMRRHYRAVRQVESKADKWNSFISG